jgi:hypothetical protein
LHGGAGYVNEHSAGGDEEPNEHVEGDGRSSIDAAVDQEEPLSSEELFEVFEVNAQGCV